MSVLPRPSRGFTLIELMITVAIVAILASVALPSYRDYVRRGQIPEALAWLSATRVRMENYYQDNRNYGAEQCATTGDTPPSFLTAPAGSKFGYACTVTSGGQGYTLKVTGVAESVVDGHEYTINQDNTKATLKFKGAAPSETKNCWLVRGDEC